MPIAPEKFSADDIVATSTPDCPVSVECSPDARARRLLGNGWLRDETVQPGLEMYAADYAAFEDYGVRSVMQPGLYIEVNLGAPQSGNAGGRGWELGTNSVVAIMLREPVDLLHRRAADSHQLRAGLWIQQAWLDNGRLAAAERASGEIQRLLQSHLEPRLLRAPDAILQAANQMTASMHDDGPLQHLRREIASLELLSETLALILEDRPGVSSRRPRTRRETMVEIREILDGLGPHQEVSLTGLAEQANMSQRSLCRHFRAEFGTPILSYVADMRMEKARLALEWQDATIRAAADIAGYSHTTNFVTAFRRRYGHTPGNRAARKRRFGWIE